MSLGIKSALKIMALGNSKRFLRLSRTESGSFSLGKIIPSQRAYQTVIVIVIPNQFSIS